MTYTQELEKALAFCEEQHAKVRDLRTPDYQADIAAIDLADSLHLKTVMDAARLYLEQLR